MKDEDVDPAVRAAPLTLQWGNFKNKTFSHESENRTDLFGLTERQIVEVMAQVHHFMYVDPEVTNEAEFLAAIANLYENDPAMFRFALFMTGVEHGKVQAKKKAWQGKRSSPSLGDMLSSLFS